MPTYYFHVHHGPDTLLDPEGQNLSGLARVELAAMREVRALLSHEVLQGHIDLSQRLEIEDVAGNVVYSLTFAEAVEVFGLAGAPHR